MAQKRLSAMDGEKAENDCCILFQRDTAALPNKPLQPTASSVRSSLASASGSG
jgi:hypothetical protein